MVFPIIIQDATDFVGFFYNGETIPRIGSYFKLKEDTGWLEFETSWGKMRFEDGEEIITINIAAMLASPTMKKEKLSPIEIINYIILHELTHWGESKQAYFKGECKDKFHKIILNIVKGEPMSEEPNLLYYIGDGM